MKTIFRPFLLLAVLAPTIFLTSCGGDDDTPSTPSTPTNECVIATDSSGEGVAVITANSNNQITGINSGLLNATFTTAGDSTFFNITSDTLQLREVLYKNGSNWAKSVQTISFQSPDFPGAMFQTISTTTPTYNSGKISSLRLTEVSGAKVGNLFTPISTTTSDFAFTYNADGNITRVSETEDGSTTNYNYTYATNTVSKANVFLFENAFSASIPNNFLPIVLGYFVPFNKMVTKMDYPDGSITFSNVTTDSKNNVSRYTMVGTGDEDENSTSVKTTYVCK